MNIYRCMVLTEILKVAKFQDRKNQALINVLFCRAEDDVSDLNSKRCKIRKF